MLSNIIIKITGKRPIKRVIFFFRFDRGLFILFMFGFLNKLFYIFFRQMNWIFLIIWLLLLLLFEEIIFGVITSLIIFRKGVNLNNRVWFNWMKEIIIILLDLFFFNSSFGILNRVFIYRVFINLIINSCILNSSLNISQIGFKSTLLHYANRVKYFMLNIAFERLILREIIGGWGVFKVSDFD
jgi:hypothetical protein